MSHHLRKIAIVGAAAIMLATCSVALAADASTTTITSADLGVTHVGTLPTSPWYFLKEWGRGLKMFFTFSSTAKTQLELQITNEKAAEALVVSDNSSDGSSVASAIENYEHALVNLQARLNGLPPGEPVISTLSAQAQTQLETQAAVLAQIETKHLGQPKYEDIRKEVDKASPLLMKAATEATARTTDAKQKAQDQIAKAQTDLAKAQAAFDAYVAASTSAPAPTGTNLAASCTVTCQAQDDDSDQASDIMGKCMQDCQQSSSMKAWLPANFKLATLDNAKAHLAQAQQAFTAGNYGEAYGQAVAADVDADGALDRVNKIEALTIKQQIETSGQENGSDHSNTNSNGSSSGVQSSTSVRGQENSDNGNSGVEIQSNGSVQVQTTK